MKVWELEEGKEYVSSRTNDFDIYKFTNGYLHYKHPDINNGEYVYSPISYNNAMELNFTEYTPPMDWSKVEVDTKVLVRDWDNSEWVPRHFAKYKDGKVHTWNSGRTSFTIINEEDYIPWNQAKLYESFKANKSIVEEMREYIGAGGETMDEKLRQWISQLNGAFL